VLFARADGFNIGLIEPIGNKPNGGMGGQGLFEDPAVGSDTEKGQDHDPG
jgi:hypothetical protein